MVEPRCDNLKFYGKSFVSEPEFVNVPGAQKSIPPAYVAWWAGTSNRVVVTACQTENRFLGLWVYNYGL
jgi:hypothetical protein